MSKNTTPVVALAGLTAVQIREMLDNKQVTAKVVIAFLREKEERIGLRYPAKKLLAELTGEAKPAAKADEPKAAKPAPTPAPAKDTTLADLLVQVRLLTERVAALEGAKAAPTPAPAKAAPTPAPAKAEPKPVVKPETAKVAPKPAPVVEETEDGMTEAEAREEFATLKVAQLREIADFDTAGMSKAEIIDEMIAQAIEEGVLVAAPAKAQTKGKPDLRVVARDASVEF
jgi:hypothetical protein